MNINVEQKTRVVTSNLIPRHEKLRCPTGAYDPLVTKNEIRREIKMVE